MKVLLVHPPLYRLYPQQEKGAKRHQMEPLSLEMIAAHNPHNLDVRIHDMDVHPEEKDLENLLKEFRPDVIGITVNTPLVLEAKRISELARKILPEVFIISGGNHCTHEPDHSKDYIGSDLVWKGDAECMLGRLVDDDMISRVRSGDMEPIYTGTAIESEDGRFVMDRLNFPYRHDPDSYHYLTMQTSRGCIWECIYCGSADLGVRWRTAANILKELDELHKRKLTSKQIYFLDDCFLDYPERVRDLCSGIKERQYDLNFWIETRADTIKAPILETIKDAGCYQITFGMESGNQRVLDSLSKKVQLDKATKAIELTSNMGLRIRSNFMIGHLDETEEEIWDTINYAKYLVENGWATTVAFYKVLPLPGTPLFRMIKERGIEVERAFEDFAWYGKTVSRMSKVDPDRLDELHQQAYEIVGAASNKNRSNVDY